MTKDTLTLAWNDMRRRKFATAIRRLEAKEDCYPNDFEYYLTLGIACLYVGDFGAASTYFEHARRIRLTDSRLLLGQAAIFLRRGDTARALQYYLEIKEYEPTNQIATKAMEFIRLHGDHNTICRWVDTGRIEQFYPQLGVNPEKVTMIVIPVVACIIGCAVAFTFIPKKLKGNAIKGPRANLTNLELSVDEKSDAREKDLTTQSYKYVLSNKDITQTYNKALQEFQNHKDNAAQIELNKILNSNASVSIKKKANILMGYFEYPDFDTISDVPSFVDVENNHTLYLDCWVNWGGKISNSVTYEDGSYSCDLLIGDEKLSHYEGTVTVYFDSTPMIDGSQSVKILGKIMLIDGNICLKGRAVYQSIKK